MTLNPIKANMTEVETSIGRVLFSYRTPVAALINGIYYRTEKKWSVTTSRHINQWLEGMEAKLQPQEFFDSLV